MSSIHFPPSAIKYTITGIDFISTQQAPDNTSPGNYGKIFQMVPYTPFDGVNTAACKQKRHQAVQLDSYPAETAASVPVTAGDLSLWLMFIWFQSGMTRGIYKALSVNYGTVGSLLLVLRFLILSLDLGATPEVKAIPMVMSHSQEQQDSHPILKCIGYNHNHVPIMANTHSFDKQTLTSHCSPTKEDSTMYGVHFPIACIAANTPADSRELVKENDLPVIFSVTIAMPRCAFQGFLDRAWLQKMRLPICNIVGALIQPAKDAYFVITMSSLFGFCPLMEILLSSSYHDELTVTHGIVLCSRHQHDGLSFVYLATAGLT
ncbi:hypothetical protein ARMGADRAFT_1035330 [Armillaria gallica]|uniref:Uncharacterized protein n=1 Tax=Armillaria gallica TaxID=47427 RepID=A0A2H3CUM3_ARMGA|nr:hypothetical protein ARMGADRAFT_1035330 [Armillaria gallica]